MIPPNFKCLSPPTVLCCVAASVGVRLVDGPGRCAGRLEIQLGPRESMRVEDSESIKASLPSICRLLGCGNKVRNVKEMFSQGSGDFFPLDVNCAPGADNISDCIKYNFRSSPGKGKALMLTCEGEHAAN